MSTSESIIQCQHLQKSFQQKAVLSDISFSISKGVNVKPLALTNS